MSIRTLIHRLRKKLHVFRIAQGGNVVMSIPLRRRDKIVGVLTLEFPPRMAVDGQSETGLAVAGELLD